MTLLRFEYVVVNAPRRRYFFFIFLFYLFLSFEYIYPVPGYNLLNIWYGNWIGSMWCDVARKINKSNEWRAAISRMHACAYEMKGYSCGSVISIVFPVVNAFYSFLKPGSWWWWYAKTCFLPKGNIFFFLFFINSVTHHTWVCR